MKALFIGGTGTISTSISNLCLKNGWELTLMNRGNHLERLEGTPRVLVCDIHDEEAAAKILKNEFFDVIADFIAYTPEDVERDIRLFTGRTEQYIFISSASAYQKPMLYPLITESTPLHNPYWEYSRNKARCEDVLTSEYRTNEFPITIVRPSHTYCEQKIPVALHGKKGSWTVVQRIRKGKKIIVPGDGTTFWTVTHSRDFAVAFFGIMGNCHAIGQTYHITGDESLTWNQIHECIGRAVGVKPIPVHIASETLAALSSDFLGSQLGDKCNSVAFDNSKIKQLVPEFQTTVRFDQGIRETIAYMDAHPELQDYDEEFDLWCDCVIEKYESLITMLPKYPMK